MTMMRRKLIPAFGIALTVILLVADTGLAFTVPFASTISHGSNSNSGANHKNNNNGDGSSMPTEELLPIPTSEVLKSVAVIGATGRTGKYAVEELLKRKVSTVVAVVRDLEKAAKLFPDPPTNLKIVQCDLMSSKEVESVCNQVDAALWCATGFSSAVGNSNPLAQMAALVGIAFQRTIDNIGMKHMANGLLKKNSPERKDQEPFFLKNKNEKQVVVEEEEDGAGPIFPKLVMCSSAGVTRPTWDDAKKKQLAGAADIPIVRLNPFGVLDVKRASEERLRQSGLDYCIVRPSGLNDEWPEGSRPIFTQGDVAVGRINRKDVAEVMVDALSTPEATGKTFEVSAMAGYAKARSIREPLGRLVTDKDGGREPSMESLLATYHVMQQMLPGERQNAAALAMGQTYEQLDKEQVGRLGKRGKEDLSKI